MARYVTTIESPMKPSEAFELMADVRNFERWDPGVSRSVLVDGEAGEMGSAYDVSLTGMTLRYVTIEHQPPHRLVVEAKNLLLRSYDVVTVVPTDDGSSVTYDAMVELQGPLGLFDALLGLAFDRIGDRAAAGLAEALDGSITTPETARRVAG